MLPPPRSHRIDHALGVFPVDGFKVHRHGSPETEKTT